MMRIVVIAALCLWVAAGCQGGLAPSMAVGGVSPDFLLVTMTCLALCATRRGGALIGFVAGLLMGGVSGANMAAYAIGRTVTGFLAGWFNDLEYEGNFIVAFVAASLGTVLAQLVLLFAGAVRDILPYLGATIGSAMYNGVLAMPLYALLKRILGSPR